MDRTPVRSSNIRAVGYDAQAMILEVEFASGGLYQYSGVPASLHQGLMQAASKGAYLNDRIKNRYPCRQVR